MTVTEEIRKLTIKRASTDEISEVAGISKPMIYAYLGAKDELFVACIRREAARLIEAIGSAVEDGLNPAEQLWRGLRIVDHRASAHTRTNPRVAAHARAYADAGAGRDLTALVHADAHAHAHPAPR